MTTRTIYILRYELHAINIARFIITKLKRMTFSSDIRDIKMIKCKPNHKIGSVLERYKKKRT
jgi:hypothetical protein